MQAWGTDCLLPTFPLRQQGVLGKRRKDGREKGWGALEWDYLKNCKKALRERIKIAPGSEKSAIAAFSGRKLSAEHLSPEECKDAEEEEEED